MKNKQPDPNKVEQLRAALEQYNEQAARGETGSFFDEEREVNTAKARKRALGLLEQRARSAHELETRLLDADFPRELVEDVVDSLTRVGLVDDRVFAHEWVRQRHARRGKSARILDQELRNKGVSQSHRQEALAQVTDESEENVAYRFAEKKARTIKVLPQDRSQRDKDLRKVVGVLARRGFSSGLSMSVAKNVLDARYEELEDL